jgi:hypothetical protein
VEGIPLAVARQEARYPNNFRHSGLKNLPKTGIGGRNHFFVPSPKFYAAFFFPALTFAHLALCAAAILLRPAAEMVCLAGVELVVLAALAAGFDPAFTFAHLAFCARAIFSREAAEIIRVGRVDLRDTPVPFKDSITEIAWPNFSTCNCASRCSARSC